MGDQFRATCKSCPTFSDVERERDALKGAIERIGDYLAALAFFERGVTESVQGYIDGIKKECDDAELAIGTPVKTEPDNKPDNVSAPLQTENVSGKTCGDCILHINDFCELTPNSWFHRFPHEKACKHIKPKEAK